jgi:hypothetical protein
MIAIDTLVHNFLHRTGISVWVASSVGEHRSQPQQTEAWVLDFGQINMSNRRFRARQEAA